jgi:hypothetical protein
VFPVWRCVRALLIRVHVWPAGCVNEGGRPGSYAEGSPSTRGEQRGLLLVGVCVPHVGMCVKGLGPWEGSLVSLRN